MTSTPLTEDETREAAIQSLIATDRAQKGGMSKSVLNFLEEMAEMSTPEEEFFDTDEDNYEDVDDYISDMGDDRLCGEYATFMDMVRKARILLKEHT